MVWVKMTNNKQDKLSIRSSRVLVTRTTGWTHGSNTRLSHGSGVFFPVEPSDLFYPNHDFVLFPTTLQYPTIVTGKRSTNL